MSLDPGVAIQKASFSSLANSTAMKAIFTAAANPGPPRIYSRVPQGALLPYITIGHDEVEDDSADEIDSSCTHAHVHLWSDSPTLGEIKAMVDAACTALTVLPDLTEDGHICVLVQRMSSKPLGSLDGLTDHWELIFKYLTDPAAV